MKTTPRGAQAIRTDEGLKLVAYKCPAGVWTIGYGHTSAAGAPTVHPGMKIANEEAMAIFVADVENVEAQIDRLLKVKLSPSQYDAVVRFVFNIGATKFAKSTMRRKINAGKLDEVPAEFMRWVYADKKKLNGLVKRRASEAAMWDGVYPAATRQHTDAMPQACDAPKRELPPAVKHGVPAAAVVGLAPKLQHLMTLVTPEALIIGGMVVLGFAAGVLSHVLWAAYSKGKEPETIETPEEVQG
jgi:lysozyme